MASIVTAKTVTVAGGNLFALAAKYLGDATQWDRIAALNGLTDFLLIGVNSVKIPPFNKSGGTGGILGTIPRTVTAVAAVAVQSITGSVPSGPSAFGSITLNANATTTIVLNANVRATSVVTLSPQTQDAANDMASTSVVASSGQFVITHANNSRVDRTFGYSVGG